MALHSFDAVALRCDLINLPGGLRIGHLASEDDGAMVGVDSEGIRLAEVGMR